MKKILISAFFLCCVVGGVGYYFFHNSILLISPQDLQDIINRQVKSSIDAFKYEEFADIEAIDIEWEEFVCSKNLECVSPKIHFINHQGDDMVQLNNPTIVLKEIGTDNLKANFSTNISFFAGDMFGEDLQEHKEAIKAIMPTYINCENILNSLGAQATVHSDNTCTIHTPSAYYTFAFNTTTIHPFYENKNILSIIQDQGLSYEKLYEHDEGFLLGIRNMKAEIHSETLGDALYAISKIDSEDITKEDFYQAVHETLNLFIDFVIVPMFSTQSDTNDNLEQIQKIPDSLTSLIEQKTHLFSIDFSLKDEDNTQTFPAKDPEHFLNLLPHYDVKVHSQ